MQDLSKICEALQDRVIGAVAEATGINRNTLGEIKSGKKTKVSKTTYETLAQYFGVNDFDQ